uniref:L-aminoadipate-semialdehyde dehydrogenase-phosphopantetheinyl transferase n=1 Tax=Macrostomum lignano TaxID=282301 RepID=A0A1I8JFI7_9PLAT
MKATLPRGESSAESFFRIMRRQLTEDEWRFVRSHGGDSQQLAAFYRIWCLKESVVKATGDGIGFSLSRLNCQPDPDFLFDATDLPLTTSRSIVYIDGSASSDWLFEEHRLPLGHVAAVAWQRRGGGAGSHAGISKMNIFLKPNFTKLAAAAAAGSLSASDLTGSASAGRVRAAPPPPRSCYLHPTIAKAASNLGITWSRVCCFSSADSSKPFVPPSADAALVMFAVSKNVFMVTLACSSFSLNRRSSSGGRPPISSRLLASSRSRKQRECCISQHTLLLRRSRSESKLSRFRQSMLASIFRMPMRVSPQYGWLPFGTEERSRMPSACSKMSCTKASSYSFGTALETRSTRVSQSMSRGACTFERQADSLQQQAAVFPIADLDERPDTRDAEDEQLRHREAEINGIVYVLRHQELARIKQLKRCATQFVREIRWRENLSAAPQSRRRLREWVVIADGHGRYRNGGVVQDDSGLDDGLVLQVVLGDEAHAGDEGGRHQAEVASPDRPQMSSWRFHKPTGSAQRSAAAELLENFIWFRREEAFHDRGCCDGACILIAGGLLGLNAVQSRRLVGVRQRLEHADVDKRIAANVHLGKPCCSALTCRRRRRRAAAAAAAALARRSGSIEKQAGRESLGPNDGGKVKEACLTAGSAKNRLSRHCSRALGRGRRR